VPRLSGVSGHAAALCAACAARLLCSVAAVLCWCQPAAGAEGASEGKVDAAEQKVGEIEGEGGEFGMRV
jgi:hypothetical protein